MAESWSLCSGAGSTFHVDGPATAKLYRLRVMVRLGIYRVRDRTPMFAIAPLKLHVSRNVQYQTQSTSSL